MGTIENCISELVFAKTEHWNFSEITLSGEKINILSEINGKNFLKDICDNLKIKLTELKNTINKFEKPNLIALQNPVSRDDNSSSENTEPPPGPAPVPLMSSRHEQNKLKRWQIKKHINTGESLMALHDIDKIWY